MFLSGECCCVVWMRSNPNRFIVFCGLPLCDVALVAYGGGSAGPTLPHSPNVTHNAHHVPILLSIAFSKQSVNTHENFFWRWVVVLAWKVCSWSAFSWVLRTFVCVGSACSKPLCLFKTALLVQNPLADGFRDTGHATGHSRLPQFQFYGSVFLSSTNNNHLLMYILRKNPRKTNLRCCERFGDNLQQLRFPLIENVCHLRCAWQICVFAIGLFLWIAWLAFVLIITKSVAPIHQTNLPRVLEQETWKFQILVLTALGAIKKMKLF